MFSISSNLVPKAEAPIIPSDAVPPVPTINAIWGPWDAVKSNAHSPHSSRVLSPEKAWGFSNPLLKRSPPLRIQLVNSFLPVGFNPAKPIKPTAPIALGIPASSAGKALSNILAGNSDTAPTASIRPAVISKALAVNLPVRLGIKL